MRISFLKHDCGIGNMVQLFCGQTTTKCPFYWKMREGDTYIGSLHFFTLFGYRIVINTTIKKDRVPKLIP